MKPAEEPHPRIAEGEDLPRAANAKAPEDAQHCPQISCIANRSDDAARWGFREENAWPVGRDGRTPLVQKLRRRHKSTCFGVNWLLEFADCAYLWAMLSVLGRSHLRGAKSW